MKNQMREEQGICLEICLGLRICWEVIIPKPGEGKRAANNPETGDLSTWMVFFFKPLSLPWEQRPASSGSRAPQKPTCVLSANGFPKANTTVLLFVSQSLCCAGNEGSTLDQPGTPVPSLWYIVWGLQGIRVVTRTRWACGLGLLTCSSTHTSKKVITQELD